MSVVACAYSYAPFRLRLIFITSFNSFPYLPLLPLSLSLDSLPSPLSHPFLPPEESLFLVAPVSLRRSVSPSSIFRRGFSRVLTTLFLLPARYRRRLPRLPSSQDRKKRNREKIDSPRDSPRESPRAAVHVGRVRGIAGRPAVSTL